MGNISQAIEFLKRHQSAMQPATIRGQAIQVQFSSSYTELKPGQVSDSTDRCSLMLSCIVQYMVVRGTQVIAGGSLFSL